jgi:DNA (cytosine-5)-methyltransferase 1
MTPRSDFDANGVQLAMNLSGEEIIVDSFAGGGGASLGISWALGRSPDMAINHDKPSITLHKANHPETEHYAEDVWHVDPVKACRGRKVGLMWLSPDCKHFSKAKGGKPVSKKLRGLAWTACRWAKAVKPRVIMLENVEEFEDWGPLYPANHRVKKLRNRPIPEKKGQTFAAFTGRLRRLGYELEWRTMRACDYGAPTIRNRFFMIARCDGQPIVWPEPTHGKGRPLPWRTAAECIDWSLDCPSIFDREERGKKRLAVNTERRIARGVMKFVVNSPKPFIVGVGGRMGQSPERGVDRPLQTVTSKADSAVVVPHITKFREGSVGSAMDQPMPTVTANSYEKRPGGAAPLGLVTPCLVPMQHQNAPTSVDQPLQTITTQGNKFNIVAPVIVPTAHQGDARAHSVEQPVTTITGGKRGDHALAAATIARIGQTGGHGDYSNDIRDPLTTITSKAEHLLVSPFLKPRYGENPNGRGGQGQEPRVRSLEEPAPVIVPTGNGGDLVATFLAKHNAGNEATGQQLDEPVHTVTGKDNKALVLAHIAKHYGDRIGSAMDEPLHTVTAESVHHALVATHIQRDFGNSVGHGTDEPVHTVTPGGSGKAALVASHLVHLRGSEESHLHGDSLDEPMRTISAGGTHAAKVCAFLFAYYGTHQQTGDLSDPAPTTTAKDRFGLVTVTIAGIEYVIVDIGMRMLQPRELFRAQGFPDTYLIEVEHLYEVKRPRLKKGASDAARRRWKRKPKVRLVRKQLTKTDQVKMCGNSVPPQDAEALVLANCRWLSRRSVAA